MFSFFITISDFNKLANSFLHESYSLDQEDSISLLCRPSKIFEADDSNYLTTSCMDMASSIQCPSYISHKCVQDILGRVWTGSFRSDLNFWQILLVFIFPPFLWKLKMRDEEHNHGAKFKIFRKKEGISFFQKYVKFFNAPITKFYINLVRFIYFVFPLLRLSSVYLSDIKLLSLGFGLCKWD